MLIQQIHLSPRTPLFVFSHQPASLEAKYCVLHSFPPLLMRTPHNAFFGSSGNSCLWWQWWINSLRESDFTHVCWIFIFFKIAHLLSGSHTRGMFYIAHPKNPGPLLPSLTHAAGVSIVLPVTGVAPRIGMCLLVLGSQRHYLGKIYLKRFLPPT